MWSIVTTSTVASVFYNFDDFNLFDNFNDFFSAVSSSTVTSIFDDYFLNNLFDNLFLYDFNASTVTAIVNNFDNFFDDNFLHC